jgi:hypothetical protein
MYKLSGKKKSIQLKLYAGGNYTLPFYTSISLPSSTIRKRIWAR